MNIANKITVTRIVIAFVIIILLLFPLDASGLALPKLFINESIVVDLKYILAGFLFILASIIDLVGGYIAHKYNIVTDFGKMLDTIADEILVNSVLIILSANGFISPIIPVVIVIRDTMVNSIKMIVGNKGHAVSATQTGKIKTACLMTGIMLTLFYNLPFELWNFKISDALLIVAAVLSLVSGLQYYMMHKNLLFSEKKEILEK